MVITTSELTRIFVSSVFIFPLSCCINEICLHRQFEIRMSDSSVDFHIWSFGDHVFRIWWPFYWHIFINDPFEENKKYLPSSVLLEQSIEWKLWPEEASLSILYHLLKDFAEKESWQKWFYFEWIDPLYIMLKCYKRVCKHEVCCPEISYLIFHSSRKIRLDAFRLGFLN